MLLKSCLYCCLFLFITIKVNAQEPLKSEDEWEDAIDQVAVDKENEQQDFSNELQILQYLKDNPINLNGITREQLEQFPFLSSLQIEHLLQYLYTSGPMESLYELSLVEDMDKQTIRCLTPFVCLKPVDKVVYIPSFRDMLHYGKSELLVRADVPLYLRNGYKAKSQQALQKNPNIKYFGQPIYQSLRYGFHYKDKVFAGFSAEKDAGEPFFGKYNRYGYDHYGVYIYVHNLSIIKNFSFGDYSFSCGQGVLINTGYSLGKSTAIGSIEMKSTGVRKHASTSEANYLRGVAGTIRVGLFDYTFLYSNRWLDGIRKENGEVSSIQETGLHRTPREMERKGIMNLQLYGTHITRRFHKMELGATGLYYFFNHRYNPTFHSYNQYYLRGKKFYNAGIDYRYRAHRLYMAGELGIGEGNHLAMLNYLSYSFCKSYQLLLLQRVYSKQYKAYFANSIQEGGMIMNEEGYYVGVQGAVSKKWNLSAYIDYFHFPWLKYQVDKPSHGLDLKVQLDYSSGKNWNMNLRYQHKEKEKNHTYQQSNVKAVSSIITNKLRYQLLYQPTKLISLHTQLNGIETHYVDEKPAYGYMVTENVNIDHQKEKLAFSASYFRTDNYDTRLYSYERGLLYTLSFLSSYGRGMRYSLMGRYDFNKHLLLITKIGWSHFFDRNKISSGTEEILGCNKSDAAIQLRYKF